MSQTLVYEANLTDLSEFAVYDNTTRNDKQGPRSKSLVVPFAIPGRKTPANVEVSDLVANSDGSTSWVNTYKPASVGKDSSAIRFASGMVNGRWMSSGASATKCPHIVAGMALEIDFACTPYLGAGNGKVCFGLWGTTWPPEVDLFETEDSTFQSMFITNHYAVPNATPPRGQAQIAGIKADFSKPTTIRYELNASGQFYYVNAKQVGAQSDHLPTTPLTFFIQTACTNFPNLPSAPYEIDLYGLRAFTL